MARKSISKKYAVFVTEKCNKSNEKTDEGDMRTKLIRMISSQLISNK